MANRPPLSVVIITLNEEHNIARCIKSLTWADEVIVVDSGSQDRTQNIARELGARVLEHKWEGYGQQKNWAASQCKYPWIFYVDADEETTPALRTEIEIFLTEGKYQAAAFPRRTWFLGRWIKHGGWYPNILTRLAHRDHSRWTEPAVHESLEVKGSIYQMQEDLLHYTFRDVGDQVSTNIKFAKLGAKVAKQRGECGSLYRIITKPLAKFLETYLWKRGFLDGVPGFVISINAAHSQFMKYVELRFEKNFDRR